MKDFKIALLGFGVAGQAFSRILIKKHDEILRDTGYDVKVTVIATGSHGSIVNPEGLSLADTLVDYVRDGEFDREGPCFTDMTSLELVEKADYDCVLEMTPINIKDGEPALSHLKNAMKSGKHAISANKGPIAYKYNELKDLAKEMGVKFYFETTVMAGMPIFNMAEECLAYCEVSKVHGILNATTNFVLEEMAKGVPWDDIMVDGRRRGFMEADASNDLEGWDATVKLTALLNVLMNAGITPDQVDRTGIMEVTPEQIEEAAKRGNKIKLLCTGEYDDKGNVVATVKPTEIPMSDAMAGSDVVAAVKIFTDLMGPLTLTQYGMEPEQTGYGLFIDLVRILRRIKEEE